MELLLSESWKELLKLEFTKDYYKNLIKFVSLEYSNAKCFPPKDLIFSALNCCDFEQ